MQIDKKAIMLELHREHTLSNMFVTSSEKRLPRILLLLAHFGEEGKPETTLPGRFARKATLIDDRG
jgi:hypothetical protein